MAGSHSRDAGKRVRASLPAPKRRTRRFVVSFFLDSEGKLKCSGEVNSAISAPSAAALRRLRSETRLRAQSVKVLPPAKRLYGAGAPPALWAGNNGANSLPPLFCQSLWRGFFGF